MDKHRNPDGTWNGVKLLNELTGLSEAEIVWTFSRTKELMVVEGKSAAEAKAIVEREIPARPWLDPRASAS
jgi:hypothetical protein